MLYLQKSVRAARDGNIKDLILCLENRANIHYRDVGKVVQNKYRLWAPSMKKQYMYMNNIW